MSSLRYLVIFGILFLVSSCRPVIIAEEGKMSEPYFYNGTQLVDITYSQCSTWEIARQEIWESLGFNVTDDIAQRSIFVNHSKKNINFDITSQELCTDMLQYQLCSTTTCYEKGLQPYNQGFNPITGATICICMVNPN